MSAQCPRCRQENPDRARFCTRCHAPLRYTCPTCSHVQTHGGQGDTCGVDFMTYGMVHLARMKAETDKERERLRRRHAMLRQIVLVPLTGGLSLVRYLLNRSRDE